jgi:hypothetical protein
MANTYVFRQVVYVTIVVEAESEDEAYANVTHTDPDEWDWQEPELESIDDENGKRLWDMYKGEYA